MLTWENISNPRRYCSSALFSPQITHETYWYLNRASAVRTQLLAVGIMSQPIFSETPPWSYKRPLPETEPRITQKLLGFPVLLMGNGANFPSLSLHDYRTPTRISILIGKATYKHIHFLSAYTWATISISLITREMWQLFIYTNIVYQLHSVKWLLYPWK